MMRNIRGLWMLSLVLLWSTGALAQEGLLASFIDRDIPLDPAASSPIFAQAKPLDIPLLPQTIVVPNGGGTVPRVSVRAVHTGTLLALQFSWPDAKPNSELFKYEEFSDAVAIQFPIMPGAEPSPFMGDGEHPVNIWQWKAAWEADRQRLRDVEQVYPNRHVDFYFEEAYIWDHELKAAFTPGRAAGNLLSQPVRHFSVEDLVAFGFGTIQSQMRQDVRGAGHWQDGRWVVVMLRALTTPDVNDVQFEVGQTVPFNVAVWDGGNGDRGGQKSISFNWWKLTLLPR
ncbi:MAG: hypothetical protein HYZ81_09365 [Nitrospinae bacterium]|nr:hypothetical protein [Nitrospinota bacterium]